MAAFSQAVSVSIVSATAIGLVIAGGLAPPAAAEPCSGPAANAAPPPGTPVLNSPSASGQLPTGRRPRGTNDQAPLPKLGPLLKVLMDPNTYRQSAPVEQQAAVIPPPTPAPGAGAAQSPNAAQVAPNAAAVPPPTDPGAAIAASTTSLAEWVSGPDSPNQTLDRFGISGADLGIPWDNGDPANRQVLMVFGDSYGYCGVHGHQWRYNTLFRSQDHDLNNGISVAPGVVNDRYSGSPLLGPNLSKQIINTIKKAPSETGIIPTAGISVGSTQFVNFMSIRSGKQRRMVDELFGCRAVNRQRPDLGRVSRYHPSAKRRKRELPDGSVQPDPATATSTRTGRRPAAVDRPIWRAFPRGSSRT